MSGGSANYSISIAEISKNMEAEGFKLAEVEAVIKTAGDDKTWNAIEGFIGKDVSNKDLAAAIGAGQKDESEAGQNKGLLPIPIPEGVNPTDTRVTEIGQFAVKQHNEDAGTKLVFIKVLGGVKWNVIAGTFYALFIETQDGKGTYRDKALVVEAITGHRKLIWYKH